MSCAPAVLCEYDASEIQTTAVREVAACLATEDELRTAVIGYRWLINIDGRIVLMKLDEQGR